MTQRVRNQILHHKSPPMLRFPVVTLFEIPLSSWYFQVGVLMLIWKIFGLLTNRKSPVEALLFLLSKSRFVDC